MGFWNTPWQASQFTHGLLSSFPQGGQWVVYGFLVLSMRRPLRRIVQFECNAYSQKKELVAELKRGSLC